MASLDLKDAYYTVGVSPSHRKIPTFHVERRSVSVHVPTQRVILLTP